MAGFGATAPLTSEVASVVVTVVVTPDAAAEVMVVVTVGIVEQKMVKNLEKTLLEFCSCSHESSRSKNWFKHLKKNIALCRATSMLISCVRSSTPATFVAV